MKERQITGLNQSLYGYHQTRLFDPILITTGNPTTCAVPLDTIYANYPTPWER